MNSKTMRSYDPTVDNAKRLEEQRFENRWVYEYINDSDPFCVRRVVFMESIDDSRSYDHVLYSSNVIVLNECVGWDQKAMLVSSYISKGFKQKFVGVRKDWGYRWCCVKLD